MAYSRSKFDFRAFENNSSFLKKSVSNIEKYGLLGLPTSYTF